MLRLTCLLLLLSLSNIDAISAQDCDFPIDFKSIEKSYNKGNFDMALEEANTFLSCDKIPKKDLFNLYVWKYKLLRNRFKKKEAHKAILLADSMIKKGYIILNLDFETLLMEDYAFVRKDSLYYRQMSKIEAFILDQDNLEKTDKVRYYFSKFLISDKIGNTPKAIEHLQMALSHVNDNFIYYKGEILKGLGNMHRLLGDFDKSLSYYKQEQNLYLRVYEQDHLNIATSNYHIGTIHYEKLEYEPALSHFLKAREVWVNYYNPQFNYMRYLNEAIGDMYWELEDKENALKYFDYATVGEKVLDNDISKSYISQADSLFLDGNYNEAISYYNNAYEWRKKAFGKNHVVTGACQNFVARAIQSSGNIELALDNYQVAIDILVLEMEDSSWYDNPSLDMTFQSHHYLLESLEGKSKLLAKLYHKNNDLKALKTAFETSEVAIDILDNMTNKHMSESSSIFWSSKVSSIIEGGITAALKLYELTNERSYLEKAFFFSEKNKALILLSTIQNNDIEAFANVPTDVLTKERGLKSSINEINGKIVNEENRCEKVRKKMLSLWKSKLNIKQNEYDLFINEIRTSYPEYYALKYNIDIVELEEVQTKILDEETALISYFSGTDNTFAFLITRQDITVRKIEDSNELNEEAKSFFNAINSNQVFLNAPMQAYKNYTHRAYQLYVKLLQPELINSQSFNRLIIVPDGILSYIPFESLLDEKTDSSSRNYKTLPYLIKSFAISYSPSVSIKWSSDKNQLKQGDYYAFAPDYTEQKYKEITKPLANLRYSEQEVKYATELFEGINYTGNEVTEDLIKSKVSQANVLHLAMHGNVEDKQPLLSKLYFNSSKNEDGLLHVYEIYNLNIPSQLVILSACNTATGKFLKGEGIMSLERAFQYAGSKSLLSTLWTVDDNASSKLTQLFLSNLKAKQPKDIALQNAKLQYLETSSPEYLTPYFWSSYKLTGNTKPLEFFSRSYYLVLGLMVIILLYLFIYLKRKSKSNR